MPVVPFSQDEFEDPSLIEAAPQPGDKVRLDPGEDAPPGHQVQVGPRGGRFYIFRGENSAYRGWKRARDNRWNRERQERDARRMGAAPAAPEPMPRPPHLNTRDIDRLHVQAEREAQAERRGGFQRVQPHDGTRIRLDPGEDPPEGAAVVQGPGGGRAFVFRQELGDAYDRWKDARDERWRRERRERDARRRAAQQPQAPALEAPALEGQRRPIPTGRPVSPSMIGGGPDRLRAVQFLQWFGLPNNRMGYLGEGPPPPGRESAENIAMDILATIALREWGGSERAVRAALDDERRRGGIEAVARKVRDGVPGFDRMFEDRRRQNPGMPNPFDLWDQGGRQEGHDCGPGMHSHDDYRGGECHPADQEHGRETAPEDHESAKARVVQAEQDLHNLMEERRAAEVKLGDAKAKVRNLERAQANAEERFNRHLAAFKDGRETFQTFERYVHILRDAVAPVAAAKQEAQDAEDRMKQIEARRAQAERVIQVRGVALKNVPGELGDPASSADLAGPLKTLGNLGINGGIHENLTFAAELRPDFWAPADGLHGGMCVYKVTNARRPEQDEAPNEIASWLTASLLGWDISPEVRRADLGRGKGHVMRWVDHCGLPGATATLANRDVGGRFNTPGLIDSYVKLAAFDILIGNTDRHGANWVVDRTADRVWAIDNGYTFKHDNVHGRRIMDSQLRDRIQAKVNLTPGVYAIVNKLQEQVRDNRDKLVSMCERENPEAVESFKSRIDAFLRQVVV